MSVQEALGWFKERSSVLQQRGAAAFKRVWEAAAPTGSMLLRTIQATGRKTFDYLRAIPWRVLARRHWKLLLGMGVVFLLIVVWKVPQWQAAGWQGLEVKDVAKVQNDARTTLVQALGGAFLLIGLYLTFRNLQLTQDKQITEHYTRAVEHLGSDKLAVRLGAIYALERIARDSERDHWPIMEILTAYVREHAAWKADAADEEGDIVLAETQPAQVHQSPPKLTIDIQAILTVIGRRTRTFRHGENERLDLGRTAFGKAELNGAHLEWAHLHEAYLQGVSFIDAYMEDANLAGAYLQGANLAEAHLERAILWSVHLEKAYLFGTHLERAMLSGAHLEDVDLNSAYLQGADLRGTHLERAILRSAYLQGADLRGTHLEGARGLTVEQLATVKTLYDAHLDPPLLAQIQRQYPYLLEKPQD
jgi:uncharacterized protein YjbI with pentapeptide repeats